MATKYEALAELARLDEQARRGPLRSIARRWPAALREAELAGPQRCAGRHAMALRIAREPVRSAGAWRELGGAAVVLWAELHPLIADVGRARLVLRSAMDPHEFLGATSPADRSRWPDPETLALRVGPRISTRSAYLWLAHQAALDLPSLNFLLFEREGSWDRRPGDPPWAQRDREPGAQARPDGDEFG